MRVQLKDKSLIEIAKEKPKDYFIKQFNGVGKTYSLIIYTIISMSHF